MQVDSATLKYCGKWWKNAKIQIFLLKIELCVYIHFILWVNWSMWMTLEQWKILPLKLEKWLSSEEYKKFLEIFTFCILNGYSQRKETVPIVFLLSCIFKILHFYVALKTNLDNIAHLQNIRPCIRICRYLQSEYKPHSRRMSAHPPDKDQLL